MAGIRTASIKVRTLEASASFSSTFFNSTQGSLGIRSEFFNFGRDVGEGSFFGDDDLLWTGQLRFNMETFDRPIYPTRGISLLLQAEGMPAGLTRRTFGQYVMNWQVRRPLREHWTLSWNVVLGHLRGRNIPLHYRFYMGGTTVFRNLDSRQFPLHGFAIQERSGRNVQSIALGLQYQLTPFWVARFDWNTAHVSEAWTWTPDLGSFREGYGLTIGAITPIGPVELAFSGRKLTGPFTTNLNIGYVF